MIKAIKLEGSSMLPLFKPGEVVLIQTGTGEPPARVCSPGDCVVYSFEGRDLLHRVVGVEDHGPLISDDAGLIAPHQVPWEKVSGRVITSNILKKGLGGLIYSRLRRRAGSYVR